jgi:hypothetical protein
LIYIYKEKVKISDFYILFFSFSPLFSFSGEFSPHSASFDFLFTLEEKSFGEKSIFSLPLVNSLRTVFTRSLVQRFSFSKRITYL